MSFVIARAKEAVRALAAPAVALRVPYEGQARLGREGVHLPVVVRVDAPRLAPGPQVARDQDVVVEPAAARREPLHGEEARRVEEGAPVDDSVHALEPPEAVHRRVVEGKQEPFARGDVPVVERARLDALEPHRGVPRRVGHQRFDQTRAVGDVVVHRDDVGVGGCLQRHRAGDLGHGAGVGVQNVEREAAVAEPTLEVADLRHVQDSRPGHARYGHDDAVRRMRLVAAPEAGTAAAAQRCSATPRRVAGVLPARRGAYGGQGLRQSRAKSRPGCRRTIQWRIWRCACAFGDECGRFIVYWVAKFNNLHWGPALGAWDSDARRMLHGSRPAAARRRYNTRARRHGRSC